MNEADKKLALDCLYYEFWVLKGSYDFLSRKPILSIEKNIGLESFLVHVRNIVYFLENNKYESDIRCSDFGITKVKVVLPVDNDLIKIDKYLSHLTKERMSNQKPEWKCGKIKNIVEKELMFFLNKVPESLKNYFLEKMNSEASDENIISKSIITSTSSDMDPVHRLKFFGE
ncbi:MAG: hypothetical protein V1905_01335 [bacterium]